MKNAIILFFVLFASFSSAVRAQVAISNTNAEPNPSAMLDISSTEKGFLAPRMTTTQMYALPNPTTGLLVYNTTTKSFWHWDITWKETESGNFSYYATISVPYIGGKHHWETTLTVAGITALSRITVMPAGNPDDCNGDIIVSAKVLAANQIVVKFSNNSEDGNDAVSVPCNFEIRN